MNRHQPSPTGTVAEAISEPTTELNDLRRAPLIEILDELISHLRETLASIGAFAEPSVREVQQYNAKMAADCLICPLVCAPSRALC